MVLFVEVFFFFYLPLTNLTISTTLGISQNTQREPTKTQGMQENIHRTYRRGRKGWI